MLMLVFLYMYMYICLNQQLIKNNSQSKSNHFYLGLVSIRINKWIPLTFCLPQKVHQWHLQGKVIEPEDINRCLLSLKPYHSLLLLCPVQKIHNFSPLDGSPSLIRLLSQYSPLKNLQTLAADADLTLFHVCI